MELYYQNQLNYEYLFLYNFSRERNHPSIKSVKTIITTLNSTFNLMTNELEKYRKKIENCSTDKDNNEKYIYELEKECKLIESSASLYSGMTYDFIKIIINDNIIAEFDIDKDDEKKFVGEVLME